MCDATTGAWGCGGDDVAAQPNQRFAVDSATGMIMSGAAKYNGEATYAGQCASAVNGAPDLK